MYESSRNYQIDYFCGWRYLLSRRFRNRVREQWGGSILKKSVCIFGGVIGMILTTSLTLFFIFSFWELATG